MRHLLTSLLTLLLLSLLSPTTPHCLTRSNTTLTSPDSPHHGAASDLTTSLRTPWPLSTHNNRALRIVRYCYTNPSTRRHIDCKVQDALLRWRTKLDSASFFGTTNLAFEEVHSGRHDGAPRYCFVVDERGGFVNGADGRAQWDEGVPGETLWIQVLGELGEGADASVGFQPASDPRAFGRHLMRLGPRVSLDSIAHEFGHVFGMIHEVARSDRDEHIHYQCANVDGYGAALAAVRRNNPAWSEGEAHTQLCENVDVADHYDFRSAEYVKQPGTEEAGGFDLDSIQMYTSTDNMDRVECFTDPGACPISAWARGSDGRADRSARTRWVGRNTHPSDGDARFVQRWYPAV